MKVGTYHFQFIKNKVDYEAVFKLLDDTRFAVSYNIEIHPTTNNGTRLHTIKATTYPADRKEFDFDKLDWEEVCKRIKEALRLDDSDFTYIFASYMKVKVE